MKSSFLIAARSSLSLKKKKFFISRKSRALIYHEKGWCCGGVGGSVVSAIPTARNKNDKKFPIPNLQPVKSKKKTLLPQLCLFHSLPYSIHCLTNLFQCIEKKNSSIVCIAMELIWIEFFSLAFQYVSTRCCITKL